jgi:polyisoprenoid-binding protein YceI
MKRPLATAFILSSLVAGSASAADTYSLDSSHTSVNWWASHLGFSHSSGKFATTTGTVTLDEAKPENSKVEVTIDTNSIMSGVPKLDEHLRNKDFLDTAKFPTATFVSDKVELTGKDTAKVTGTLTLHGVAKPVVLDVKLNKLGEHPMSKKKTAGFSAKTTLKRSDFGVSYGLPAVGDEVRIEIESEANIVK